MSLQAIELELTPLQQAYWIGEQEGVELGGVVPHVYVEYDIDDCDLKRLESAWWRVVARHEGLRAMITSSGSLMVLSEIPAQEFQIHDLRARSAEERAHELESTRSRMTHTGPSSRRWPLFEIQVSRITDSVARLHLTVSLLIQDAHSWAVLPRELHALYTDPATPLAPIDSLAGHRARLAALRQTDRFREAWEYWQERLAALPPAPSLPQAKNPAAINATRFTARERRIESSLWEALRANANTYRLTPSATLTMVYADVLAKYSSSQHFTLNLLTSMRGELEAYGAIDNLCSTLLLEVQPAPRNQTFEQRTRLLQRQLMRDLEYGIVGGVEIIRESARQQKAAARAIMPIVFASALYDEEEHLPGWTKLQNRVQTAHVLIDYHARVEAGAAFLHWETIDEVYPDGLIDDMFADYCERVDRLVADRASWRSPLGTPIPSSQLARRQAVNSTAAPLTEELLHDQIERQVREMPDAPAVIATDRVLTYRELSRHAHAIARWLVDAGATGRVVSVLMERSWEQVAAVLGILRAGAAYLPLDPSFPSHRVAHILDHACCRHVLLRAPCQLDTSGWSGGTRQCRVDELAPLDHGGKLADRARPDDLAYVIYTSGSTGSPKGVAISHRGAVNTVQDISDRFSIGSSDRVLALSLLNFDLSVWDIFGTLRAGGAVVIPSAAGARDPAHWVELVRRHRITVWNSVPAYVQMLVEHCATSREVPGFPTVRLVMMSGDWIPTALPKQVAKIAPAAKIISLGGATEASIWSIIHEIDQVDPVWNSIPYGRPLRNQWFHVLDENLEHRPDLVPGNLYIGGVGLALGYYRDEALTRASFITHPVTGERLYRTGDRGCYHPSGDIEFLGRDDGQVKVRGFRIELGEIETVLRAHAAVQDAVVIVSDDRDDRRLVAYLVPDLQVENELTVEHVRRFARARLPEYMVPSAFTLLDRLPLSPNGKLDRRALAGVKVQVAPKGFVAPRTELESALACIWKELLGHSPIGIHDSFFELGGHSLLALRLMRRLQERFSVALPLSTFSLHSTIEALARLIETGARIASSTPVVPIQPHGSKPPVFCVHPSGGNVLCYQELARRLGDDQPVFGLEAAEPDDRAPSCEAMARSYVAAIRQVQQSGPYRLAGWSTGGVIAFEIARQLRDAGEKLDLLVLIDSWAKALTDPQQETPADLSYQFARDIVGARRDALAALENTLNGVDTNRRLARTIEWLGSSGAVVGVERAELERIYRIFSSNVRAAAVYQPNPLAVPMLLLVCSELASDEFPDPAAQPSLGWDRVIPAAFLQVAQVAGNHYTLLRAPHVAAVAKLLSRSFDRR